MATISSPVIPASMSNTPALPCTTTALLSNALALVDQYTLRDLLQHGAPSACGLQPLSETVVPGGGSRGRGARSTPPSRRSAIAGACSSSATSSSETATTSGVEGRSGPIVGGDPTRPLFRRLARPADQTAGPNLPGSVLRRADPAYRPHHPPGRRRTNHVHQRPRRLRPRQPGTRNAWLAYQTHRSGFTADRTPSTSRRPPATTTSAAPQTHHENGSVRRAGSDR